MSDLTLKQIAADLLDFDRHLISRASPIADVGTVPTQKCPKYATSASFTVATW